MDAPTRRHAAIWIAAGLLATPAWATEGGGSGGDKSSGAGGHVGLRTSVYRFREISGLSRRSAKRLIREIQAEQRRSGKPVDLKVEGMSPDSAYWYIWAISVGAKRMANDEIRLLNDTPRDDRAVEHLRTRRRRIARLIAEKESEIETVKAQKKLGWQIQKEALESDKRRLDAVRILLFELMQDFSR